MTDKEIDKYIEELEPFLQKEAKKDNDTKFVEWAKNYLRDILKDNE